MIKQHKANECNTSDLCLTQWWILLFNNSVKSPYPYVLRHPASNVSNVAFFPLNRISVKHNLRLDCRTFRRRNDIGRCNDVSHFLSIKGGRCDGVRHQICSWIRIRVTALQVNRNGRSTPCQLQPGSWGDGQQVVQSLPGSFIFVWIDGEPLEL